MLVERGRYWGAERVFWEDEGGVVRSMPAAWTSVGEGDAFREISAGRSAFRVEDLEELVALVAFLSAADSRVEGSGSVKGILPDE